jgi:hypothetical protein
VQEQRAREVYHTTRWEWRQATREGGSPLLQRLGTGVADYAHAKMLVSPGFQRRLLLQHACAPVLAIIRRHGCWCMGGIRLLRLWKSAGTGRGVCQVNDTRH